MSGHKNESSESQPTAIFFIFVACLCGALIRSFLKLSIPYTALLLVLGCIVGVISSYVHEVADYTTFARIHPHNILHIFLPVLIFESAFAMDAHIFMKSFVQIVILAVPGLCVASFLTCLLAIYVFDYGWDWKIGMMFGSMMSATDPVAVVALLKDLGASEQLATVIEGESLLNDGAALVLFHIFLELSYPGNTTTGGVVLLEFLRVAVGGSFLGLVMGKLSTFCLKRIFNDAIGEITITLAATYLTFYMGEVFLHVSGVLAVVVLGLVVSAEKTSISPEVEVFLHRFWEMLAYLANTLIFILVGIVITEQALAALDDNDWFYILTLYAGLTVIRALTIALFSPLLRKVGYGMSWKNGALMTWGGLRGAVSLALALIVARDDAIDQTTIGNKILLHCSAIVFLTLTVNATTIKTLMKHLEMTKVSAPKRVAMASAVRDLEDKKQKTVERLRKDRFLEGCDWDLLEEETKIHDPYHDQAVEDGEQEVEVVTYLTRYSTCPCCESEVPNEPSAQEWEEMLEEARLRLLKMEKISYWKQFEQGMLSRSAVRILIYLSDVAADTPGGFIRLKDLKRTWQVSPICAKLKTRVHAIYARQKADTIPVPHNRVLKICYRIQRAFWFETFVYILILVSIVPIVTEFVMQEQGTMTPLSLELFRIIHYIFICIYCLEAGIKILGQRKWYFFCLWNDFDFFILILCFVDVIIENMETRSSTIMRIREVLRLLRIGRALRLYKLLIPLVLNLLNLRINKKLMYGYDIAKGFVRAEDEVMKGIDHMIDDKNIAHNLKEHSYASRIAVVKELGHIQREHPGIAVSVKTRQAIRSVLNSLHDAIDELREDGLLNKDDTDRLDTRVREQMKRTLTLPPYISPPLPAKILANVSWVSGHKEVESFVKEKAQLTTLDYKSVIIDQGELPKGIYVLLSGMVKEISYLSDFKSDLSPEEREVDLDNVDYLTTGNVLGEMGVLTMKPSNTRISCETAVQCYFIPLSEMQEGMRLYPRLKRRLWRVCALRRATIILMQEAHFQGWTRERIKLHLEKAYLADVEDTHTYIIDHTVMNDVILVYGEVNNAHTHERYHAPVYIKSTVRKLELIENGDHVILIVPSQVTGHYIDSIESDPSVNLASSCSKSNSQLCLKHASRAKRASKDNPGSQRRFPSLFNRKIRRFWKGSEEKDSEENPGRSRPFRTHSITPQPQQNIQLD